MDEHPPIHPALERYRDGPPQHPRTYRDLHEHVLALAREGLLVVVDEPINKDTEMHPLVRWQYRGGIGERDRRAFLFTQPTDGKGTRYDSAVLVAGLAANPDVYRIGFGRPLEESGSTWAAARHESLGRIARRYLCALAQIQGARRADAVRGCRRRSAACVLCGRAENAGTPR